MALPPERVSIKRKRDTESVDVLFIQDSKRPRKQFVFKRIASPAKHVNPFAGSSGDGVSQQPSSRPQTPRTKPKAGLRPRQFHLDRSGFHGGAVSKVSSPRSPTKRKLAVLVEDSVKKHGSVEGAMEAVSRGRSVQQSLPSSPKKSLLGISKEQQQQQLKPRASAAELRWREEKWGPRGSASRSLSRGPTQTPFDARELKLAHQLDAFALEQETKATPEPAKGLPPPSSPLKKRLKFQPKASAAGRKLPNENSTKAVGSDESESDYEYDTYERVPYDAAAPVNNDGGMDVDLNNGEPTWEGKSIGVLVIADEDEDLWASYQEIDDSDVEFDTDDEDENAEDYYGNDYPEDELDSEDEHGRGAYGYRYAGSDDEQYGDGLDDDENGYSGDEDPSSRTTRGQISGSWTNDFASPVQNRGLNPY